MTKPASGELLQAHRGPVGSVEWSPDGRHLATAGAGDGTVRVWAVDTAELNAAYVGVQQPIWSVQWSPDGSRIACGGYDGIPVVFDARSGEVVSTFSGHNGQVLSIAWAPDSHHVASGSMDGTIAVWSAETGAVISKFEGTRRSEIAIRWSDDGGRIGAASYADLSARIWALNDGNVLRTAGPIDDAGVNKAWSRDLSFLAAGSRESLIVWDLQSGGRHEFKLGPIEALGWSKNTSRVAAVTHGAIRIVSMGLPDAEVALVGPTKITKHLSWSTDDTQLALGGTDGVVRIWRRSIDDGEFVSIDGYVLSDPSELPSSIGRKSADARDDDSKEGDRRLPSPSAPELKKRTAEAANHIFISYRRADTEADAGRLFSDLSAEFGPDKLYMDVDSVPLGQDVHTAIRSAIAKSRAVVALVGPNWEVERLERSDDWVRIEIETAIEYGVRVIPVRVRRAEMPSPEKLPPSVESFARLNAAELEHSSWHRDLKPLLSALHSALVAD